MHYNPSVIAKLLSSQAYYINVLYGQMFYYIDTNEIWWDTQDGERLPAHDIMILGYEYQRNNLIPDKKTYFVTESGFEDTFINSTLYDYVYVVETNCLYLYNSKGMWQTIYGIYGRNTVAQTYYPDGKYVSVSADDVTTNGILNDGSVVVRDGNKMICGLLKSDGYVFNINSLIGGQLNLNPSGKDVDKGCLQLNADISDEKHGLACLNGDIIIFGDIYKANKEDWEKQYRLVTENIVIDSQTLLKTGSTIKSGSILNDGKLTADEILINDITITSGLIVKGSKLYKDTVINNTTIKPPFILDKDNINMKKL